MIKPFRIFAILIWIITLLVCLSLVWPNGGFRFGSRNIHFPSVLELFNIDTTTNPNSFALKPELALLNRFLDSLSTSSDVDTTFIWKDVDIFNPPDSANQDLIDSATTPFIFEPMRQVIIPSEILKNRLEPIQFPDTSSAAIAPFFDALTGLSISKKQVRVLHFGDSQIEGDRVTSFLRSRLQAQFGGGGIGLLPAVPNSYQPGAVNHTISANWQTFHLTDFSKGALEHRFGILGGFSNYTSNQKTTKGGFTEAWLNFQRRGASHLNARNFTQCRLLYGYGSEPFMVSISYSGKTQDAEMLSPSKSINQITWRVPLDEKSFQLDFKGDESPLIYGVSLETVSGVVVDNIALRGSSGIDFTRADDASLQQVLQILNPKLLILQFGVNVAPNIVGSYTYYQNQLRNQILALKRAKPDMAILLIGISDMSRREGNRFVSYPNIEKIRDAQRNAAISAGAAFWDCFTAMGGENSMPSWVYANPPLASKDFVHFTLRGSNLIAEMFYSALMESYNKFLEGKSVVIEKK